MKCKACGKNTFKKVKTKKRKDIYKCSYCGYTVHKDTTVATKTKFRSYDKCKKYHKKYWRKVRHTCFENARYGEDWDYCPICNKHRRRSWGM